MICKECGAYNSDTAEYCRVCSAKLTDTEPVSAQEEAPAESASARPARRFAQMPTWSKEAYSGATARRTFAPAAQPAPTREEPVVRPAAPVYEAPVQPAAEAPAARPAPAAQPAFAAARPVAVPTYTSKPTVTVPDDPEPELCPNCGNRLLADTPYCPYCGKRVRTDIEPAPSIYQPTAPVRAAKPIEKPAEKAFKPAEKPVEKAVAKPAARAAVKPAPKDEYFDDDEYDDDEYDDYNGDDEEEYEEEEGERKGGSSTVFWILIAVLVLLIGGIAFFLLKTNGGIDGIKSLIGLKTPAAQTETVGEMPEGTGELTVPAADPNEIKASIEECVMDNGVRGFMIDITAPAGNTVHIITTAALKTDKAQIGENGRVQIKVPESVFIPDEYCEAEQVTVTPQIELIRENGSVEPLVLPDISVNVPALTLALTEPAADTVEENRDGSDITVSGTVSDGYAELTVNGKPVTVYEGNVFNTTVSQEDERSNGGIILVELKKKGCATARASVTVNEFVVKDIEFTVAGEGVVIATDRATAITGTVTPGATITATPVSGVVSCGTAGVTDAGNFSVPVTLTEDGIYAVTLKAECDGYNTVETTCLISSKPEKLKTFKTICSDMADVYDGVASGSVKEKNVIVSGKVEELLKQDPQAVVKIKLSGDKYVYVINYSEKKTYSSKDIGKSIEITGAVVGTYEDTGCPLVWGWFATIK